MNGAQDLGGQHGFGPVRPEADEPVFHDDWERRALAVTLLMGPVGRWSIDQSRAARESLPPVRYLSSSYYEIWIAALEKLMAERGLLGRDEIDAAVRQLKSGAAVVSTGAGRADASPSDAATTERSADAASRCMPADKVQAMLAAGGPSERPATTAARFAVGDVVRTHVMNPLGHTRLPRYARGRCGTVVLVHGAHVYPDASGNGLGEDPHWLYTVRFEGEALWGADTSATSVHVDCWEPYLEPA